MPNLPPSAALSGALSILAPLLMPPATARSRQAPAAEPSAVHFERRVLTREFFAEGAAFGDLDRDGIEDVVAGPWWHRGPRFDERRELRTPRAFDPAAYSDSFFTWVHDVDGDGWNDVVEVGFPGAEAAWYENPRGASGHWSRHLVHAAVDNESPAFCDLDGDGVPELVFHTGGRLGFAAPDPRDPRAPWRFRAISADLGYQRFQHGLGVGDVDGDGRADVLTKDGWWRQPPSLDGDPAWERHAFPFAAAGGAQMLVLDVDGDGDADVVTSLAAHGFGLAWFEQVETNGGIGFVQHPILGETAAENADGRGFAEIHALAAGDLNGDGLTDFVTGKRFWSHGQRGDPELGAPAVLAWFELRRGPQGVRWIQHRIDDDSGVGTQVAVGDVDGDGRADVVTGNKRGLHVFLQRDVPAIAAPADPTRAANLDFEDGTLRGWRAEGAAFAGQPVYGDLAAGRGREPSLHAGKYWIGGWERLRDTPTGTLTSEPFRCEAPFASFLVGGGAGLGVRVELLDDGAQRPFFATSGAGFESMQRVVVDLTQRVGLPIVVRLVDEETGHWGHINFDDFRFHAERPEFPHDPPVPPILPRDPPKSAGLSPAEAARAMTVPEGFRVELVAAEPDLHQPVALAIDPKGRLWVAEAHSYPEKRGPGAGRDAIRVFEDRDGDGSYETRTTFLDGLDLVSGLETGFGGVWIGQAPELLFVPDADDDLVPDGPPRVVLDGFGLEDTHETLNSFRWGPDGWLYGCHGVFTHSRVGAPGTPDAERVPLNAGVWRFHPRSTRFEVFAWGTSNPWGLDFDARGEAFVTACVIPHLFHVIQGGRFHRQAGEHFDAHVYADLATIADHRHFAGSDPHAGNGRSDAFGGGHAHCGALIVHSASFPERWRGRILMGNVHGNRLNADRLERAGASYVGRHDQDFLLSNDAWFRAISLASGPDGALYLIDWYDAQACHDTNAQRWDRTNGRLYRVAHGAAPPRPVDLRAHSSLELVALQRDPEEWFARAAQLVLAERGPDDVVRHKLEERFGGVREQRLRLRALWTLHASGNLRESVLLAALADRDESVCGWGVRIACEAGAPGERARRELNRLAESTDHAGVRLQLASAAQRLPPDVAREIVERLVRRRADEGDDAVQKLLWCALEPLVAIDPAFGLRLAPLATERLGGWILRRAAWEPRGREELLERASGARPRIPPARALEALRSALADDVRAPMPSSWPAFHAAIAARGTADERAAAMDLGLLFGDELAFPKLRERLADASVGIDSRRRALDALARGRDRESVPVVLGLLDEPALRVDALRALGGFDDPRIAPLLIGRWAEYAHAEREAALESLCARPSSAVLLLEAVRAGGVPRAHVAATALRTLENLHDARVAGLLAEVVGVVRRTSVERQARIDELKLMLDPGTIERGDRVRGREMFAGACSSCHTLFGAGGTLAPDLTGSNRKDLDYLLSNVVDPSAVITKEYQVTMLWLEDERLVTGLVRRRSPTAIVLATGTGEVVVDASEVLEERLSPLSTMPDGLLEALDPGQIVDLVAYLQGDAQVPRRATRENAASIFDGRTLSGWTGDAAVWRVEDGELVGRAPGLERNAFLRSDLELSDFRLVLEVRLVGDQGNSGIQFRSRARPDGDVEGLQADVGPGWWGKLYEEHGRGVLSDRSGERAVVKDGWNRYEIVAVGSRVLTAINGVPCADLEDPAIARGGIVALQVHSGAATEVRFRGFVLELDPEPRLTTLR
ncbi:MAG: DUF1080 domain-containing protein [Planctomycetes bacterium]|nr:DUF1080 domain-containing protein [Planctomycetota bacterium]